MGETHGNKLNDAVALSTANGVQACKIGVGPVASKIFRLNEGHEKSKVIVSRHERNVSYPLSISVLSIFQFSLCQKLQGLNKILLLLRRVAWRKRS